MYLNESLSEVREVSANDDVQTLVDLINDGGQLSWTLTPSRLNQKLTSRGKLFGLYVEDKPVGVIGIKGATVDGIAGGEIGYLYIEKGHRSLPNAAKLYDKALSFASDYTFLMATTVTTNVAVNTLLKRSSKSYKVFTAKSPFSSNRLNYWLTYMNSGVFTREEIEEAFHEEFGHNVEETLTEDINFIGHQNTAFAKDIDKIASAVPMIHLADEPNEEDINIVFNRRGGLPNEDNTIYVGNKFVGKLQQHNTVKSHIPTIKTLSSSDGLENFIAKRNTGWKQQGQLINQEPDDPENYIFQPYLDIISEYRVVVYFMNGDYHVLGNK